MIAGLENDNLIISALSEPQGLIQSLGTQLNVRNVISMLIDWARTRSSSRKATGDSSRTPPQLWNVLSSSLEKVDSHLQGSPLQSELKGTLVSCVPSAWSLKK